MIGRHASLLFVITLRRKCHWAISFLCSFPFINSIFCPGHHNPAINPYCCLDISNFLSLVIFANTLSPYSPLVHLSEMRVSLVDTCHGRSRRCEQGRWDWSEARRADGIGEVVAVVVVGKMSSTDCRGSEKAGEKATKNIVNISPSKRFCTLIASEGGPISIPLWLLLL